jgi:uncharacterized damage-inducible protein DinB
MPTSINSLMAVYEGWDGYQHSILQAVTPLTCDQLAWRPAAHMRSAGELVRHIALGRIEWFVRMHAPGSLELASQIKVWEEDGHGNRYVQEDAIDITEQAAELVKWLEASWQMVNETLKTWTVDDLGKTYRHTWRGSAYAISRQWTIWRIMAHDIHHGGELSVMLGMQGIDCFELGGLGGHIIEPPLANHA